MAGSYSILPGETQSEISTWIWPGTTTICVQNHSDRQGKISMAARGFPTEYYELSPGINEYKRSLGGVLLTIKNEGDGELTVTTS